MRKNKKIFSYFVVIIILFTILSINLNPIMINVEAYCPNPSDKQFNNSSENTEVITTIPSTPITSFNTKPATSLTSPKNTFTQTASSNNHAEIIADKEPVFFTEPSENSKNKIQKTQLNYDFSYSYLDSKQQVPIKEVFNFINGENFISSITLEPGLNTEKRREIYTYFALYFSNYAATGEVFDAYYSDACTIFNLCPEQIILFVEEKNKIDKEIDKSVIV